MANLLLWTQQVMHGQKLRACSQQELMEVLRIRDEEETLMLAVEDAEQLVYFM